MLIAMFVICLLTSCSSFFLSFLSLSCDSCFGCLVGSFRYYFGFGFQCVHFQICRYLQKYRNLWDTCGKRLYVYIMEDRHSGSKISFLALATDLILGHLAIITLGLAFNRFFHRFKSSVALHSACGYVVQNKIRQYTCTSIHT